MGKPRLTGVAFFREDIETETNLAPYMTATARFVTRKWSIKNKNHPANQFERLLRQQGVKYIITRGLRFDDLPVVAPLVINDDTIVRVEQVNPYEKFTLFLYEDTERSCKTNSKKI